jgi:ABC-type sugar transport system permease subunit
MIVRRAVTMRENRKWIYIAVSILLLMIVVLWIKYQQHKSEMFNKPLVASVTKVKEIDYKAMYQRDSVLLHALMDSIVVLRTMITAKENVVVEIPKQKSIPRLSVSSSKEFNDYLMTRYKDSIQ